MGPVGPQDRFPAGSLGRPGLSRAAGLGLPHPALPWDRVSEESPVVRPNVEWDKVSVKRMKLEKPVGLA